MEERPFSRYGGTANRLPFVLAKGQEQALRVIARGRKCSASLRRARRESLCSLHYRVRPRLHLFRTPDTRAQSLADGHLFGPLYLHSTRVFPAVNKRVSDTLCTSFLSWFSLMVVLTLS